MDLIYTNANREDVGVLKDYKFDLAFGADENDFELTLDTKSHCCGANCLVYIEGTEYGGIVDKVGIVTKDGTLSYFGRTWQGILASKIIEPDPGEAYLTVSGDVNRVIESILERVGLSDLFTVPRDDCGLIVDNYSFDRYTNAYSGITKMVTTVFAKLKFTFIANQVNISIVPIVDYSQLEQFDNDNVEMVIEKTYNAVNHMICLGKGELTERQVVHLYMDEDGNVSETQTFFGLREVTAIYNSPNAESLDELVSGGKKSLREYANTDNVRLNFPSEENAYDIGDIIGAKELTTGTSATEKITKKIVTIDKGMVNIQYKVGE
jgi:hypothetical protein